MADNANPYLTVGAPNYAGPMMDWQKMAQGMMPQQVSRPPITPAQGPQGATAGQPNSTYAQMGGQGPFMPQGQQPNQAQQQMQGLGARLRAMFGGGQPGPQNIVPQGASNVPAYGPGIGPSGPVPLMPPQGNPGLY
jgi:hypothetical protein